MTLEQLKEKKVVIFSHYATTGACEELRDWLIEIRVWEVVYIAFPFGSNLRRPINIEKFRNGARICQSHSLFRFNLPEPFAYAKDFLYALYYAVRWGQGADILIAGDNLLATAGILTRWLIKVRHVIYYMIDYTPIRYANRMLNACYYNIDRFAASHADEVWPLTEQIISGRFAAGRLDKQRVRWHVAPYGCHPVPNAETRAFDRRRVVYMGDVVRSKGADLFVPFARELSQLIPEIRFTIIGGGRDLTSVQEEVQNAGLGDTVEIKGFVPSIKEVIEILAQCALAIAPYDPRDPNNFTFYSDPGKIKVYLGCGLPIVLTDVPPIARTLAHEGAGHIAPYDPAALASEVAALMESPDYASNRMRAAALGRRFEWSRVFKEAFASLDDKDGDSPI